MAFDVLKDLDDEWDNGVYRKYTPEAGRSICEKIATSHIGVKKICESLGIPYATVIYWRRHNEHFKALYAAAKEEQADYLVDEMLEISDSEVAKGDMAGANMKKLAVETRKFIATKLKPKVYGNNSNVEVDVKVQSTLSGGQMKNLIELAMNKKKEESEAREISQRNEHIQEAEEVKDGEEEQRENT